MKSSPKLYNFDALYENCKETFENPKGTPLQKKSKFRKKISVVCLNVEIPTGLQPTIMKLLPRKFLIFRHTTTQWKSPNLGIQR